MRTLVWVLQLSQNSDVSLEQDTHLLLSSDGVNPGEQVTQDTFDKIVPFIKLVTAIRNAVDIFSKNNFCFEL